MMPTPHHDAVAARVAHLFAPQLARLHNHNTPARREVAAHALAQLVANALAAECERVQRTMNVLPTLPETKNGRPRLPAA